VARPEEELLPFLPLASERAPEDPVLGGSLTRSPEGRLQTLQTHGIYPSPQGVQEVWTSAKRRRYRKVWEGQKLEPVGYVIEWDPRKIACGACGRALGAYAGYRICYPDGRVHEEQGIVEDTTRRYERDASSGSGAGSRGPRSQPRFWREGEVGMRAARTTACFRCPGCKKKYRRNLARLGAQFFARSEGEVFVLE
jgi:hypothetical protein